MIVPDDGNWHLLRSLAERCDVPYGSARAGLIVRLLHGEVEITDDALSRPVVRVIARRERPSPTALVSTTKAAGLGCRAAPLR